MLLLPTFNSARGNCSTPASTALEVSRYVFLHTYMLLGIFFVKFCLRKWICNTLLNIVHSPVEYLIHLASIEGQTNVVKEIRLEVHRAHQEPFFTSYQKKHTQDLTAAAGLPGALAEDCRNPIMVELWWWETWWETWWAHGGDMVGTL
jgi:hypothetical protein